MCLNNIGRRKIAKADITVWKYGVMQSNDSWGHALDRPVFISPSQLHRFQFGRTCRSVLRAYDNGNERYVLQGFHTFKNRGPAVRTAKSNGQSVVRCTIPKGSTYYEGRFGRARRIASDRIVINEVLFEYLATPFLPGTSHR